MPFPTPSTIGTHNVRVLVSYVGHDFVVRRTLTTVQATERYNAETGILTLRVSRKLLDASMRLVCEAEGAFMPRSATLLPRNGQEWAETRDGFVVVLPA